MYLSVWWSDGYFCLKCSMLEKTPPCNLSKFRMETLKLSISVLADSALKISSRVIIRALKL